MRQWLVLSALGVVPVLLFWALGPQTDRMMNGGSGILLIGLIILTVGAAWYMVTGRTQSLFGAHADHLIAQYRQFAERVAAGDLTARLDLTTAQGSTEFVQLA